MDRKAFEVYRKVEAPDDELIFTTVEKSVPQCVGRMCN